MTANFTFKQGLAHLDTLAPVHELFYRCQQADGHPFKNYWHILYERRHEREAMDFLCVADGQVVGALNVFFFSEAIEIVPYVDPQFRHRGIAKKLLQITFHKLQQYIVPAYSFIIHDQCVSLLEKCRQQGGELEHSEVEMHAPAVLPDLDVPSVSLRRAEAADIPQLAIIHEQSFPQPDRFEMEKRLAVSLRESYRKVWLAYNAAGEVVGKIHLRDDFNRIVLHDVGILSAVRQQNYGKALMLAWLKQFAHEYTAKPIVVEVLEDNIAALRLYERCGFNLMNRYEVWKFAFGK